MRDIKTILDKKKEEYDALQVPEEMEIRLREALYRGKAKKTSRSLWAAALIALIITTYSFDTLAFYGKKLLGYENIVPGSIALLNEEGAGQHLNKHYQFCNGVEINIDSILFDENELVILYRLTSSENKLDKFHLHMSLAGIKPTGYVKKGGRGFIVDDYNMISTASFESPGFYEKWMRINILMTKEGKTEEGVIKFTLDRNKAIKRVIKQDIQQEIAINDTQVLFEAVTASRLSTVISGKIELGRGMADFFKESTHLNFRFDIFVDGKKYAAAGDGVKKTSDGIVFSCETMGVPLDFTNMELRNIRLVHTEIVDKEVEITNKTENLRLHNDILIKSVSNNNDSTEVVISSKGLPIVGLEADGKVYSVEDAHLYNNETYNGFNKEKTYIFKGKAAKMKLVFKALTYSVESKANLQIK